MKTTAAAKNFPDFLCCGRIAAPDSVSNFIFQTLVAEKGEPGRIRFVFFLAPLELLSGLCAKNRQSSIAFQPPASHCTEWSTIQGISTLEAWNITWPIKAKSERCDHLEVKKIKPKPFSGFPQAPAIKTFPTNLLPISVLNVS